MFELTNLVSLFSNRLFRIPDYQRGYAWEKSEIEDFWRDITNLRDGKNHYTGVLTLEKISNEVVKNWSEDKWLIDGRGYTAFYIVDGQQRITTSIILIKAIIDITFNKYESSDLNYSTLKEITETYVYKKNEKSKLQSCIFSYEKGNPSYYYFMSKILGVPDVLDIHIENTKYTQNLEFAYDYFYKNLNQMSFDEIQDIFRIVSQRMLFNMYFIGDDLDIFVTFETMNNRGKPLSVLELLKNRLIYLSSMFLDDDGQADELRKQINNGWKDVYHYLGKNKNKPLNDDIFLAYHTNLFFPDNNELTYEYDYRKKGIYYSKYLLNNYYTTDNITNGNIEISDILKFIRSIKKSVYNWYVLNNESEYRGHERTRRILISINDGKRTSSQHSSNNFKNEKINELSLLLLALLNNECEDIQLRKILKLINTYEFLKMFIVLDKEKENYYGRKKEDSDEFFICYSDYFKEVINQKVCNLEKRLTECINSFQTNENVKRTIKYFFESGFYQTKFPIKYFFVQYERYLSHKSQAGISKLDYEGLLSDGWFYRNNIEHIFPQRGRNDYWTSQLLNKSHEQIYLLKNSLGNLVIINEVKNSKLANLPFPEKKAKGFIHGNYSENELLKYDQWTILEITDRGMNLLKFMIENWDLNILNNDRDKVELLGLSNWY
ncbi:DUF262 domain-containing protein [Desulfosporosinus meridiei]|uniref:DUF262 domain-containing protein n=1 Tax=Desulfosporosinus meridiei (strain ATCC BAA-275 / DSM 13257 / KCTC 12902 / NCIMB 13706 / S10) TaxID=768704 RepID=J7J0T0_DESMD|nr:DUF262 domain-containing protein [Desulfosporosinus meridiei]AFQ44903.1 hypothetical protein Desmer_3019 [Desulfosporosinus meridiei DSM 13257]